MHVAGAHTPKIDRSFIVSVGHNRADKAIVRALVGLGASLGLKTVAKGIDTDQQALALRSFGCDIAQGYLFDAVCVASEAPALIERFDSQMAA